MNIVITGAGGFLGSNICNNLSIEHNILALSRKSENIQLNANVKFVKCNLENIDDFEKIIIDFNPDILIHCAWIGGNNFNDTNSVIQFQNIISGLKLLEIVKKSKISKFIGIGSAAEFGFHTSPVNEEHIKNPYSLYGSSKKYFYDLSKNICDNNNIDFTWIYPVYVYGQNDISTRLIPKVIKLCLGKEKFTLDSCDSLVDYLYVEDFVFGVNEVISNNVLDKIIISSGKTYKIKDIVENIANLCNFSEDIFFDSTRDRKHFQKYFCGNNLKLINTTNWSEKYDIDKGLNKTIRGIIDGKKL